MTNESDNPLEKIRRCSPFENNKDFIADLCRSLEDYDLIDLLEKLSCLRVFVRTSFLECEKEERSFLWNVFNDGFTFLFPFLLCYKVSSGDVKIGYPKLRELCRKISLYSFADKHRKDELDPRADKISYLQNNLTDLIGGIKRVPVEYLLSCQDKLLKRKYGVTAKKISDELLGVFERKIYWPLTERSSVGIDEFIRDFNAYINADAFMVKKGEKAYLLCKDLSAEFGEFGAECFSVDNPLSVVNLKRKLFIKAKGHLYNLCDDLICGRLNRSVESLFKTGPEIDKWRQNYKERIESLPKEVFEQFLPGGTYYENAYYRDSNDHQCESDGIYLFHDFIFVIEVKGNKFNPDPIYENQKSVEESYKSIVAKAERQGFRTKQAIMKRNEFSVLSSDGKTIGEIRETNLKKIICICIYYEDIGTFLAGQSVDVEEVIHITFYDLLIAFFFIENPFLITKYLLERSGALKEKRYDFNDEMTFLSLFRTSLHLNDALNSQSIPVDANIGGISFPNNEFGSEIELYFIEGGQKPEIEINGFIRKIINLDSNSDVDDNVFTGVFDLLNRSPCEWEKLEIEFGSRNFLGRRAPLWVHFADGVHPPFVFLLVSASQHPSHGEQNLFCISKCFATDKSVEFVYLYEIGDENSFCKKFQRQKRFGKTV